MDIRISFTNTNSRNFPGEERLLQILREMSSCGIGILCCSGESSIVVNAIPPENDKIIKITPDDLKTDDLPNEPTTPANDFHSTQAAANFIRTFLQSQSIP